MASYEPPIENLAIFDPNVFIDENEPLLYSDAVKKFLKYPIAQGKETLQAIDVNGVATFKSTIESNTNTDLTIVAKGTGDFVVKNDTNSLMRLYSSTDNYKIAIGNLAGAIGSSLSSIAVGKSAGYTTQNTNAIAIGTEAGYDSQGGNSIALGREGGRNLQNENCIAIGNFAGKFSQGVGGINTDCSIAIGYNAGLYNQGLGAVALGENAGAGLGSTTGQKSYAVAIGKNAGGSNQGISAIAIGYKAGVVNQHNNSIILNATGNNLNSAGTSRCYIDPIRTSPQNTTLGYDATAKELTYYSMSYAQYLQTGNQLFSASTPADIQLNTSSIENGISRSGNVISFNRVGVFKVGISMLVEEAGGSSNDFYFSFTDAGGVIASSGSVFHIAGNKEKTLAYAEIIYNSTSTSATIKVVGYTTSAGMTLTSYTSPNASIASSPAVILTVYQLN